MCEEMDSGFEKFLLYTHMFIDQHKQNFDSVVYELKTESRNFF